MSKATLTRQFIIEKTAPIFNKKGYAGTSLSDITEATGLTKGSIYGNFQNKEEVALAAYKHNVGQLTKQKQAWLAGKTKADSRLAAFVDFYRKNWKEIFENGGCPILNAATDSDDTMPPMKSKVKMSLENWEKDLEEIFQNGIDEKTFNPEIDKHEYATLFIMIIEGGILLSKISDNPEKLYLALDRIQKIISEEILL